MPKRVRVLICGDRNWTDWATILSIVMGFRPGTVVIEGEARGADRITRRCAEACGLEVEGCPADWHRFGPAAGPIRNTHMLQFLKPDFGIAFHTNLSASKGTADMVRKLQRAGKPVILVGKTR